ncbi:hypothetical protein FQN50_000432 [Emmonsiellopsis sp. PD_5]|nr:hypothetical protein FQN50_000432 [Emmonsiellopsis sp. PD_5]
MAPTDEQTLSQEIQAELQAKRQRLAQLQQDEVQALAYMNDLHAQAHAMQQLNTSGRKAQEARMMQNSGRTVEQQIQDQGRKVEEIKAELTAVKSTIELLSGS